MTSASPASAQTPNFEAGSYPATIDGTGNLGIFKFATNGGNVECKNEFDGTLSKASTTLKVAITYTECKAFGFLNATVNTEGCEWVMHATEAEGEGKVKASLSLECPTSKSIKISVSTCAAEMKPQSGLTPVKLINDTEDVTFKPEIKMGVKYTVTKDGFLCPLTGTGEFSDGELSTSSETGITLTAAGTSFQVDPHAAETHEDATLREEVEHAEHTLGTTYPSPSQFTAGKYPAIIDGFSAEGVLKLTTEAGSLQCENTYFGEATKASSTLDLLVFYESCSIPGIGEATISAEECGFRLHAIEPVALYEYTGRLGIKCEMGESIQVTAGNCSMELKEQAPLTSVKLISDTTASPAENVTLKPEVKSIKYKVTKDGTGCPFSGTGTKTNGELTSTANITLTAQNPAKPSEKYNFRVGEKSDDEHFEETHETETLPRFKVGKYPAVIHGSGSLGVFTFNTNGGTIECQNTFKGTLNEASTTLRLAVTYSECKAFGFLGATVNPEGCELVLHNPEKVGEDKYESSIALDCPTGKSLKVTVSTCAAEYKTQTGLKPVWLYDDTSASPFENVTFEPMVTTGAKYTVTKDGFLCPLSGTGEYSDGQVSSPKGAITLTAEGTGFKVS